MTGIDIAGGKVRGVQATWGDPGEGGRNRRRRAIVATGDMAGFRLPVESHVLQAFFTEGLKTCINHVVTYGMGHFYISQSDKGGLVFGGDLGMYSSCAARGNLPTAEQVVDAAMTLMPMIGKAPVDGVYINCGWCHGWFKATSASGHTFAHLIATDQPHPVVRKHRLDRSRTGCGLMDQEATGARHNLHQGQMDMTGASGGSFSGEMK